MRPTDVFSSRWGLLLAGLGMAVGTGNLWRFPRVAAQNGGGAFLIPWLVFLVLWSIPLIVTEFGIGRHARRGPIGAFTHLRGRRAAWMGGFVVVTTSMIMAYYSVVTGWTLKYTVAAVTGALPRVDPATYWQEYSVSIWQPALFHLVAIVLAGMVVVRGVVGGIERANRVLIPGLFLLLLVAVGRAVTLPGADRGLAFLFLPDWAALTSYRTWLEALTQSAWSTGAGWGLILGYAVYVRDREDVVTQSVAIGLGNNLASIVAALAVIPAAFALLPAEGAAEAMAAGNMGLTFIWIPRLFAEMPAGEIFLPFFFGALACAALSSLIAMVEVATRTLVDTGLSRPAAVRLVVAAATVVGLPSAVSLEFFENQDWVWGLALMVSGLFIASAAIGHGVDRFRDQLVNTHRGGWRAGRVYTWILTYLIPVEFAAMFGWWMYQAATVYDPDGWWNPIRVYSVGTCVLQWGVALAVLAMFNTRLALTSQSPRATLEN